MPIKYQFAHELRHLVAFHAVACRLHFRQAAEELRVAQPALSRQIAQLENALGTRLFQRTRRRVELTAAGTALLEQIEPLLHKLHRLPDELRNLTRGEGGRLRIGYTGLAMATLLPALIRKFSRRHPGVRIELAEMPTSTQVEALRGGELDCGFFHPRVEPPEGIRTRQLLHERNGLLLPVEHPLAHTKVLRLRDVQGTPFILFPRPLNSAFYDHILAVCAAAGVTLQIVEEIWPRANAVGLVRAGLGVTFITPSEAHALPSEVVFRRFTGPAPESRLVAGWAQAREPTPAATNFIQSIAQAE